MATEGEHKIPQLKRIFKDAEAMNILAFSAKKTTKFDLKITSNSIAIVVEDYIEALVLQQFHYWIQQGYGVVIRNMRWIYKSIRELIIDAFPILTPWKLNKAIVSLVEKGFLLREHLFAEHHGHNFYAENRTYYHTVNYAKIEEVEAEFAAAEENESSRFEVITETDSKYARTEFSGNFENISENTSIEDSQREKTHPNPSQNRGAKSNLKSEPNFGGGNSPSSSPKKKPITKRKCTQPKVKLFQVIARPEKPVSVKEVVEKEASNGDVDEKVNNWYVGTTPFPPVQEYVLNLEPEPEVQETVQTKVVQESVQVESEPPPKPKREKTRKGTKPKKRTHDHALWKTMEERNNFERELTHRVVNGVGKARNPMALVRYVMNQITQGISHPYWEEWISGVVIGSCETQEWEASPGHPYPKFVEYLIEKLKYDGESRSQAQFRLGKILDDVSKARIHWREFKRIVEGLGQDGEKAAANGQQVALPVWFIDRAEISLERAAESAQKLNELAPEQKDWIYRGLPESEKLLTDAANSLQPGIPEIPPGQKQLESKPSEIKVIADPWTDGDNNEEDEDFCFNGFIDMGYLEQQAKKVAANPGKLSLLLMDFKSAVAQATQKQREKIRQMLTSIYPELLDFL